MATLISGFDLTFASGWTLDGGNRLDTAWALGLGFAAIARFFGAWRLPHSALVLLTFYTLGTLLLGQLSIPSPGLSGWEAWVLMLCGLLYGASIGKQASGKTLIPAMRVCILAATLTLVYQAFLGQPFIRVPLPDYALSGRMFTASATVAIGLAVIGILSGIRVFHNSWTNSVSFVVLIGALVSLQQRTVTLSVFVGIMVLAWLARARLSILIGHFFTALKHDWRYFLLSLLILVFILSGSFAAGRILELSSEVVLTPNSLALISGSNGLAYDPNSELGFFDSFGDMRNFYWRLGIWSEFMKGNKTGLGWVFGQFSVTGSTSEWSSHSQFIDALRLVGIIGLVTWGITLYVAYINAHLLAPSIKLVPKVTIVFGLVYGISYEWSPLIGLLVGFSLISKRQGWKR